MARRIGLEPRVAILGLLHLRPPEGRAPRCAAEAVRILDRCGVDFEYDGEMAADVALDRERMALYPFCRLTGTGQCAGHAGDPFGLDLDQDAAAVGGATVIGPLLVGLESPCISARSAPKMAKSTTGGARGVQYRGIGASSE